jgi:hypothetical protein
LNISFRLQNREKLVSPYLITRVVIILKDTHPRKRRSNSKSVYLSIYFTVQPFSTDPITATH